MALIAGSKYGSARAQAVQTSGRKAPPAAPQIFVPTLTGSRDCLREWFWRELKDGGFLHTYLRREKHHAPKAMRRVARMMDGFKQNARSDFRLMAAVPARLYQRWKAEDKDFFADPKNLKSLRRDNPDACVYV